MSFVSQSNSPTHVAAHGLEYPEPRSNTGVNIEGRQVCPVNQLARAHAEIMTFQTKAEADQHAAVSKVTHHAIQLSLDGIKIRDICGRIQPELAALVRNHRLPLQAACAVDSIMSASQEPGGWEAQRTVRHALASNNPRAVAREFIGGLQVEPEHVAIGNPQQQPRWHACCASIRDFIRGEG